MTASKIIFSKSDFPIGAALTCGLVKVEFEIGNKTCVKIEDSFSFTQSHSISRYIARLHPDAQLYPANILSRTEVDNWLSLSSGPALVKEGLNYFVAELNDALQSSPFLVGNALTIADLEAFGVIYKNKELLENSTLCKINEWFDRIENKVKQILKNLPVPETKKIKPNLNRKPEEGGKFFALPGAEKGMVVVRFPPEASGYLHIGHAKAALLNQYYQKEFEGKFIMRFDDTNPAKEDAEFEKVILGDLKLLQIEPDLFTHTSDLFPKMLELCDNLIRNGHAYADDTDAETMKKEREERKCSKNRDNSMETNLTMWEDMKSGSDLGQKCCIRAKIDMVSNNGCLRDPTIYRCKNEPHIRTGTKYKTYPTYDFACPIVDSMEGVTHALRTTEYHDRDVQYNWFIEKLNLRPVIIYDYARLNMNNTVLSKRKLTWFVQEGLVNGWDDPRFPTVRGILRRGMTVEGLKEFIIAQGSSRSVVNMEWDKIWSFNKKVIDRDSSRYTALEGDLVPVTVINVTVEAKDVQKHPKDPTKGTKKIWMSPKVFIEAVDALLLKEGENATFINWGNLIIKKIFKTGDKVTSVEAETNLENTDYKKTLKLTWLAETDKAPWTPVICTFFDHLITKSVLAKEDDFKQFVGRNTRKEVTMVGDDEMKNIKAGEIIQLQRKGFFRIDEGYTADMSNKPIVAFYVPDGHTKDQAVTIKATKSLAGKTTPTKKSNLQKTAQTEKANEMKVLQIEKCDVGKTLQTDTSDQEIIAVTTSASEITVPIIKSCEEKVLPTKSGVGKTSNVKKVTKGSHDVADNSDKNKKKKQTRLCIEAKKVDDFADWYSQVITKSHMIDYYNVSGCYILRPWAYSIWNEIRVFMDAEIKKMGVQNCYFPLLVSKDALEKEKDHIQGFSAEVAWITRAGSTEFPEPVAIRPTSETIIYPIYAKWVESHRDLPLKLNQWSNVVRWEFKQPTPFLRSREFLWQEGHTCFATEKEAFVDVHAALDLYNSVYEDLLAVPVVKGRKTEKEKFAGAVFSITVEAFVSANGRAIQAATAHYLGQNFSKMCDITFEDPETKETKYCHQNSWGLTTRSIGIMIMVHGDDKGLVLPPRVAEIQVVIIPVGITAKTSPEEKQQLIKFCDTLYKDLNVSIRCYCDDRDNITPGWKFNHWELKGVPMRIEIGPKEMLSGNVCLVRRDTGEKLSLPIDTIKSDVTKLIETIHNDMFAKAKLEKDNHTIETTDWQEFNDNLDNKNIIMSPFCGEENCEDSIKKDSTRKEVEAGAPSMGAKSLCIPFVQPKTVDGLKCIYPSCSNQPKFFTLFGRSY